jgi:hypothetical protein
MKSPLPWLLATLLCSTPACIIVHVRGDLDEEFLGESDHAQGFRDLKQALEGCLTDPEYDLDLSATPWHTQAEWTVRYAGTGSDGHAAFTRAREAVLRRIEHQGGTLTGETHDGPHAWSCSFLLDGDEGEASVRLAENTGEDEDRPHRLEVVWEEDD